MTWPAVWTAAQRRVVVGVVLVLSVVIVGSAMIDPVTVPDPPGTGGRAAELSGRLDPNTADATALSAIPTLGEKRARDLVAYREAFVRSHPGRPAFASPRDLLKLRGIGASTIASMDAYLRFPTTVP